MDCCKLGSGEARFAQHASQLTGGMYLKPSEPQALLQNLLVRVVEEGYQVYLLRRDLPACRLPAPCQAYLLFRPRSGKAPCLCRWCLRRGRVPEPSSFCPPALAWTGAPPACATAGP